MRLRTTLCARDYIPASQQTAIGKHSSAQLCCGHASSASCCVINFEMFSGAPFTGFIPNSRCHWSAVESTLWPLAFDDKHTQTIE